MANVRAGRALARPQKRQRKKDERDEEEAAAVEFNDSDVESASASGSEAEEEAEETAAEKRLRLAKEYLDRVRAAAGGDEGTVAETLLDDALGGAGARTRPLAGRLRRDPQTGVVEASATLLRGHRLSVTGVAVSPDGRRVYAVSKDGALVRHAIGPEGEDEEGQAGDDHGGEADEGGRAGPARPAPSPSRVRLATSNLGRVRGAAAAATAAGSAPGALTLPTGAPWRPRQARREPLNALLSVAVSEDGQLIAVGGGDARIRVWDERQSREVASLPGHRDAVTAVAFRLGSRDLFSASLDRSVKAWGLDDMTYADTLFGHQAEVLALDALRTERVISSAADRTCRLWKIPEESHLICRANAPVSGAVAFVRGGEWISGDDSGDVCLWSSTRKKPVAVARRAHAELPDGRAVPAAAGPGAIPPPPRDQGSASSPSAAAAAAVSAPVGHVSAGHARGSAVGWVQSVAVARGSDLAATGAGDGRIRLWRIERAERGFAEGLTPLGDIPVRGFVNSLAFNRSGDTLVAAVGQEPRLGRWIRDKEARNGVLVLRLGIEGATEVDSDSDSDGDGDAAADERPGSDVE